MFFPPLIHFRSARPADRHKSSRVQVGPLPIFGDRRWTTGELREQIREQTAFEGRYRRARVKFRLARHPHCATFRFLFAYKDGFVIYTGGPCAERSTI